jgi:TonB-linked SusC/RagA family outer membrane protein
MKFMVRKFLLSVVSVVAFCSLGFAQNRPVSGVVTNEEGSPVIGVIVTVQGTTTSSITDASGRYTVTAPASGSLEFSSFGLQTQVVAIDGRSVVDVVMAADATLVEDVIVVAFGTAKREAFTGSASVVTAEALGKRQTTNVVSSLVGSVPGLQLRGATGQPGSSMSNISIRGIASMYAGTSPLIILDGSPFEANLSNIPQSDIESITVLKDASSAALYGARGAAGVIIITTKKGIKKGSRDATINVDMKWGVNSRAIPTYDIITDPGEYYEATYAMMFNQEYYGLGYDLETANINANRKMLQNLQYDVFSRPEGEMLVGVDGKLNPKATLGREYTNPADPNNTYWLYPDSWMNNTYRQNLRHEYNVSVNGGDERTNFYSSLGYLNDGGIIDHSNFERLTARIRADYQAKKWLKVSVNAGYTHYDQDQNANWGTSASSSNLFYYASGIAPIYPLYVRVLDESGNPVINKDQYGNDTFDYGTFSMGGYPGLGRPFLGTGNPIGENNYNKYLVNNDLLNGTFTADFDITNFLRASIQSSVNYQHSNTTWFGNMYYGTPAVSKGYVEKSQNGYMRTTQLQTLNYYDTFGQHSVDVLLGHEYYNNETNSQMGRGQGVFSPEILELNATALSHFDGSSSSGRYNVEGFFARANYDFADKYYFDAMFRLDGTSRFAKQNRWGDFWAVGAAWILSKEDFMSGTASWIDMLKIRGSIGQRGNDNIGDFLFLDRFNIVDTGDNMTMAPTPATKGNPDITWETTTSYTLATEFNLFGGRLNGSVDFYYNHVADMLFSISLPESTGFRNMYGNIGNIRNRGIEVVLNGSVINTRNVNWTISANIAHNTTKILSLPDAKVNPITGGFNEGSRWYTVGGPLYNAYRQEFAGLNEFGETLFYKDKLDADGRVEVSRFETTTEYNDATRYAQGSVLPKFQGGFGTTLTVKGFDLSLTFDYQIGGKVYDGYYANSATAYQTATSAGSAIHKDWAKSWSPNNTESTLPRWRFSDRYSGSGSTRWMTDASYLNFQSFTIGYTLPKSILKDAATVRVYAAGENLHFWSARKGFDPRYSFESTGSVLPYSPMRTISGGLQLTF